MKLQSLVKEKDVEKDKELIERVKGKYLNRKLGFTTGDLVKFNLRLLKVIKRESKVLKDMLLL